MRCGMSIDEGLQSGIDLLRAIILTEPVGKMWWA
jgi:hypothetical protein